ncbi:unnamed protein product, partial [marine sediment metagenome]
QQAKILSSYLTSYEFALSRESLYPITWRACGIKA